MDPHRHSRFLVSGHRGVNPSSRWDTALVRRLIEESTVGNTRPAFLILGKREARMLRRHLGTAFGPTSVQSLKNTYYMGLQVIEDPAETLICVAGRKNTFKPRSDRHALENALAKPSRWRFSA